MRGQTSLPNEMLSMHLQVEAAQSTLPRNVAPRVSIRFLCSGYGFAALMLIGLSAWAAFPLVSHVSAKTSRVVPRTAFSPSLPAFSPRGTSQAMYPASVHAGLPRFRPRVEQRKPTFVPHMSVTAVRDEASSTDNPPQAADRDALKQQRAYLLAELDNVTRALGNQATTGMVGSRKYVFEPAFGYLSQSAGVYTDVKGKDGSRLPSNALDLAIRNFGRELPNMMKALNGSQKVESADSKEAAELRAKLDLLVLDNDKVWAREKNRPAVEAPLVLLAPYYVLCFLLDVAFDKRPIARFWFLETVARMPYFSYISALHLYETLGWWRRSAITKRVHFAEEWNEFHHLLTMEALGGDQLWQDRFLAQHSAIVYYWVLIGLWFTSPSLAYKFSELIEAHAVDTYGEFVDENRDLLAELPAPRVSRQYWTGKDLHLFDEFQTSRPRGSRRVSCETLLDVFENIRDDEAEHVATMVACQDPKDLKSAPKVEAALIGTGLIGSLAVGLLDMEEIGAAVASVLETIGLGRRLQPRIVAGEGEAGPEAGLIAIGSLIRQTFEDTRKGGEVNLVDDSLTQLLGRLFGSAH